VNAALWWLIGMQLRGWLRFFSRSLLTLKGALLAILGGTFFILWMLSVAVANSTRGGIEPSAVLRSGPSVLLIYCFMNVMLSSADRGIYFTPAEINFLFPAPMTRRSLLAYKIVASLIVGLPSSLILSAISYGFSNSFLTAFTGMMLIVLFMQLFTMAINLIAVTLGAALYTRARRLLLGAAILVAAVIVWEVGGNPLNGKLLDWLQMADQSRIWQTITLPLTWFFETFRAKHIWPDLVLYASLSLMVNGVLLGIVFALDAQYMEAAAFASARVYARLQRIRIGTGGPAPSSKFRFALPLPPSLGGVGTLCWRQITTSVRMPSRLIFLAVMFCVAIMSSQTMNRSTVGPMTLTIWAGATVLLTAVFLTAMLPFDFRGDVDRIALLKTLPIPPWRLALGQVLAPVLLVSLVQWLVLAMYFVWIMQEGLIRPGRWPWHPGTILSLFGLFALPVNALLFALENLLFLLFPTRIVATNPADFQALGRNVLFLLAKSLVLGSVFSVAALVGFLVGMFYLRLGYALAWLTIALFTAPLIPLIGWAFTIFDVGRDTPA
jgi:Putative ABC exporter